MLIWASGRPVLLSTCLAPFQSPAFCTCAPPVTSRPHLNRRVPHHCSAHLVWSSPRFPPSPRPARMPSPSPSTRLVEVLLCPPHPLLIWKGEVGTQNFHLWEAGKLSLDFMVESSAAADQLSRADHELTALRIR